MTRQRYDEILSRMFLHLEENLDRRPLSPLSATSHLVQDLHLDSMDSVHMISELEDHYGLTLPLQLFQRAETLGDVAAIIDASLGGQS